MTQHELQELLIERFTAAEHFYLEGLEFGEIPDWHDKAADLLDDLSESVQAIPSATLETTLRHRERLGEVAFDNYLIDAVSCVGRVSFPMNATEFLNLLNLGLEHIGL